jgi:ubiquinone/menaquinone biosynthesis C-methylase UbiE
MEFFFELYDNLPRQGPGSDSATRKALAMIPDLPERPAILDIGCGTGAQTLILAEQTRGYITAVDFHPPYLEILKKRAKTRGLDPYITTMEADMNELAFPNESFDLIWSEGAIYIMGFANALQKLTPMLKPGCCMMMSEIVYFCDDCPEELTTFFKQECPDMMNIKQNLRMIESTGYRVIDHFSLPEQTWWDSYYTHLDQRVKLFENQALSDEQRSFLELTRQEIDLFRRFGTMYGYEYFIVQPIH